MNVKRTLIVLAVMWRSENMIQQYKTDFESFLRKAANEQQQQILVSWTEKVGAIESTPLLCQWFFFRRKPPFLVQPKR